MKILYICLIFLQVQPFYQLETNYERIMRSGSRVTSQDNEDIDAGNIMTDFEFAEFLKACDEAQCGNICGSLQTLQKDECYGDLFGYEVDDYFSESEEEDLTEDADDDDDDEAQNEEKGTDLEEIEKFEDELPGSDDEITDSDISDDIDLSDSDANLSDVSLSDEDGSDLSVSDDEEEEQDDPCYKFKDDQEKYYDCVNGKEQPKKGDFQNHVQQQHLESQQEPQKHKRSKNKNSQMKFMRNNQVKTHNNTVF